MRTSDPRPILAAAMLTLLATGCAVGPIKAAYQVSDGTEQASRALEHIRNQLEVDPQARIVVVAFGRGLDFLLQDAKDAGGYPYALIVEDLHGQGVRFEACAITLRTRGIDPKRLDPEAVVVPSGMDELARLQTREGYAYLKP
jgi:intracellular sulfur oxidation DsrE/DsrF family protein